MADTKQPIRIDGVIPQSTRHYRIIRSVRFCVCQVGDPGPIFIVFLHSSMGSHGNGWVHQVPVNGSFLYLREVQDMKVNEWFDWKEECDLYRGWDGLIVGDIKKRLQLGKRRIFCSSVFNSTLKGEKPHLTSGAGSGVHKRCLLPWLLVLSTLIFLYET